MKHELKCWPEYFDVIVVGSKTFELRKNDRNFHEGDILWLREWSPDTKSYSGREEEMRVGFIIQGLFGLADDVCCMSLLPMLNEESGE